MTVQQKQTTRIHARTESTCSVWFVWNLIPITKSPFLLHSSHLVALSPGKMLCIVDVLICLICRSQFPRARSLNHWFLMERNKLKHIFEMVDLIVILSWTALRIRIAHPNWQIPLKHALDAGLCDTHSLTHRFRKNAGHDIKESVSVATGYGIHYQLYATICAGQTVGPASASQSKRILMFLWQWFWEKHILHNHLLGFVPFMCAAHIAEFGTD